jgi:hypothetical protein
MNKIIICAATIATMAAAKPLAKTNLDWNTMQSEATSLGTNFKNSKEPRASMYKKNPDGTMTEVPVGPMGQPINMGVKKSHARLTDGRLLEIPDDFDH